MNLSGKMSGNVVYYNRLFTTQQLNKQIGYWTSVTVINDSGADCIVTINNLPILVKDNEILADDFVDFNTILITCSGDVRVLLRE